MPEIIDFISQNIIFIIAFMFLAICVLFVVSVVAIVQIFVMRKKYKNIANFNFEDGKLDEKFKEFFEKSNQIDEKYDSMSKAVMDLNDNMDKCIQKVSIIRYNPFDEEGGNLCFAVALLDNENNGIILNGIHSRSGSYTYAKPIDTGVSEYILSYEEKQALNMAVDKTNISDETKETIKQIRERYENEVLPKRNKRRSGLKKHSKASL